MVDRLRIASSEAGAPPSKQAIPQPQAPHPRYKTPSSPSASPDYRRPTVSQSFSSASALLQKSLALALAQKDLEDIAVFD